jgi:uncharacterized sulfatase
MRKAQQDFALEIRDVGFLPEAEMHRRTTSSTPYEFGHDDQKYPLERIMAMAELASCLKADALPELEKGLEDKDSGVRYWAALGILMRGKIAVESARGELEKALTDESPSVRIVAAQALGQYGAEADLQKALPVLLDLARYDHHGLYVTLEALNAVDALGAKAAPAAETIKALPTQVSNEDSRSGYGVTRLIEHILENCRQ